MAFTQRIVTLLGQDLTVYLAADKSVFIEIHDVILLGENEQHKNQTRPGKLVQSACKEANLLYASEQVSQTVWVVSSAIAFCYIQQQRPEKAARMFGDLMRQMQLEADNSISATLGKSCKGSKYQNTIAAISRSDEHKQYALSVLQPQSDNIGLRKDFTTKAAKSKRLDCLDVWEHAFRQFAPSSSTSARIGAVAAGADNAAVNDPPTAFSPPPPAAGELKDQSANPERLTPLLSTAEPPVNNDVVQGFAQLFILKPQYLFKILLTLMVIWPGKAGDFGRLIVQTLFPQLTSLLTDKAAAVFYGLSASRHRWTQIVRTCYSPLKRMLGLDLFPPVQQLKVYFQSKLKHCLWMTTRPLPASVKLPKFVSNCPGEVAADDEHASTRKVS